MSNSEVPELGGESNPALPPAAMTSAANSRRLLLKGLGGLGAASPIILSVASGPVYSRGAGECLTPSGFISQNTFLSRHPGVAPCSDRGPTFYASLTASQYPSSPPPNLQTVPFVDAALFGTAGSGGDGGVITASMLLVNVLQNGSVSAFTKYAIAGYLNARTISGFPMTPAQAIAVWQRFRAGGASLFIPASWSEATALAWLQSLMAP